MLLVLKMRAIGGFQSNSSHVQSSPSEARVLYSHLPVSQGTTVLIWQVWNSD